MIKEWLGMWYPTNPNADLKVVQLNCLDPEYSPPISEVWAEEVQMYLDEYENAVLKDKKGTRLIPLFSDIYYYNNRALYRACAESVFDFVEMFREELRKESERYFKWEAEHAYD